jgi:hypothetical protein
MKNFVKISRLILIGSVFSFLYTCKKDKPVPPLITTTGITNITYTTATSGGNISDEGGSIIISKGICWKITQKPTTADNQTNESNGANAFVSNLSQLKPGTTYYVRAYATNSAGTGYGNEISFSTSAVKAPSLTTSEISAITSISATSGGNITDDNGSEVTTRGICWNTSANPLITDKSASAGTGKGVFECSMADLDGGTTYYVRAYATNSAGTSYGNEVSFATNPVPPSISTLSISLLTTSSLKSGGTITSTGGATITACGLCWDTSPDPTISQNKTTESYFPGDFTSNITGLVPNTIYHVRAYATNSAGTSTVMI